MRNERDSIQKKLHQGMIPVMQLPYFLIKGLKQTVLFQDVLQFFIT